jgi:tRNA dimethylallyltransferase
MDFSSRPETGELRRELERKAAEEGPEALHRLLEEKDPAAAERIHPNNVKKIIRALEILGTGEEVRPFEHSFVPVKEYGCCLVGLTRDREELYKRIDRRVDLLMEQGLAEEVRRLMEMGLTEEAISMKGIGYKEIFGFLKGEYDEAEAVRLIKRNTRRYAKRQLTWLRRYDRLHWVDLSRRTKEEAVAEILRFWESESWL